MAFLEAMAEGLCVVAPDGSTMNEYIVDGQNGFLYDASHPAPIDLSGAAIVAKNSFQLCRERREQWLDSENELFDCLADVPSKKLFTFPRNLLAIWRRGAIGLLPPSRG